MNCIQIINAFRVKLREKLNPFLGKYRKNKLENNKVTIISNNCWAGHVYRYFGMKYLSPTIGLYFFADDYIKFCDNLKYYLSQELTFINAENSKHYNEICKKNEKCPIGKLDDIEIFFLHYKTPEEAFEKWNRRKKRIVWDNLVFKFSEQNCCTKKEIVEFNKLPYERKFVFTTKDYNISSQILWGGPCVKSNIPNDTILFREYVDPIKFINGEYCKKRQKYAEKKLKKLNNL